MSSTSPTSSANGHRAHADPPPRQPPRFPVPGRRHRDLHHRSRRFAALRGIQQQAEFHQFSDLSSLWKQMVGHVSGRPGLQETGAISDRESVATTIFISLSRGKRGRDTNVLHSLKDREISTKSLNGKLTRPSEEREWLSKKCRKVKQKWRRGIGKRETLTSLFNRPSRSLNLNDFNCTKQVGGQIWLREIKKSACMENWNWEIRSSKKIMQGIAKKLKNWQANRARHARSDALSMQQQRNPTTVSQIMAQIRELQKEQSEFLVRCMRIFTILNQGAALERLTFPIELLLFQVPELCCAAMLDCRVTTLNGKGITGSVFERPPAQEGLSSKISFFEEFGNILLRDWELILQKQQGEEKEKWKENRWPRPLPK